MDDKSPRLHTIYRSAPGDNRKGRPEFYSKDAALRSFVSALEQAPPGDRVFVNDGPVAENRVSLMRAVGEVVALPGVGNCRSFRACVGIAEMRDWSDNDLVYFVEDDYLHLPKALSCLAVAASATPSADYFTLYDHPDKDRLVRHRLFRSVNQTTRVVGRHTWMPARSTCLTFGARLGALREDAWVFHLCSRFDPPADYAIWAILGGRGVSYGVPRLLKPRCRRPQTRLIIRGWLTKDRRPAPRKLYGPSPSLATHIEDDMLAPGVDWAHVSAQAELSPNV